MKPHFENGIIKISAGDITQNTRTLPNITIYELINSKRQQSIRVFLGRAKLS